MGKNLSITDEELANLLAESSSPTNNGDVEHGATVVYRGTRDDLNALLRVKDSEILSLRRMIKKLIGKDVRYNTENKCLTLEE
jgi:hypothetical protein